MACKCGDKDKAKKDSGIFGAQITKINGGKYYSITPLEKSSTKKEAPYVVKQNNGKTVYLTVKNDKTLLLAIEMALTGSITKTQKLS